MQSLVFKCSKLANVLYKEESFAQRGGNGVWFDYDVYMLMPILVNVLGYLMLPKLIILAS
ncbi:MAG: hypothetical protein ACKESB_00255 [Candidatus Hodgkinia cicadicola]